MTNEELAKHIRVNPSILSADFGYIADEVKRLEDAGADEIHIDIMDGHFVPNLTMGPKMCAAINSATDLFLDVHIMAYNPFDYIERFVQSGADRITFHLEATEDVEDTLNFIRKCNIEAGLAICPETSETLVTKYLDKCDLLLLMTVHPGFGGQEFIPDVLEKVSMMRSICDKINLRKGGKTGEGLPPFDIQVDGGINKETAKRCFDAGANVFVAGSSIFAAPTLKEGIDNLKEASRG